MKQKPALNSCASISPMKITFEIKDDPRGRPPIKIKVDQAVHRGLHVHTMVSRAKKMYPWAKIIDIRIDLH